MIERSKPIFPRGKWDAQPGWLVLWTEKAGVWESRGAINSFKPNVNSVSRGSFEDVKAGFGWRIGTYAKVEDAKRALLRHVPCWIDSEAA